VRRQGEAILYAVSGAISTALEQRESAYESVREQTTNYKLEADSSHPIPFEEVIADVLKVKPPAKPKAEQKPKPRKDDSSRSGRPTIPL
jgi:hypothetical protein